MMISTAWPAGTYSGSKQIGQIKVRFHAMPEEMTVPNYIAITLDANVY